MSTGQIYVVRSNDTLGKIAKDHNVSVSEMIHVNHIKNPDRIDVGQKIVIPSQSVRTGFEANNNQDEEVDGWGALVVQFVDAINRPIHDLAVKIESLGGIFEAKTDEKGVLPPLAVKRDEPVKVHVARAQGGVKHVATVIGAGAAQHARIISPKVAVMASLRKHEGPAAVRVPAEPRALGDERSTRSQSGNPVHEVALECPNPQSLRLVANFKYRDIIIAAASRIGLSPQAVAAIINTESGKISRYIKSPVIDFATQKPKLGKDGKPLFKKSPNPDWHEGEWDSKSTNTRSSARGMTQFLDGSWLELACTKGVYLNSKAKQAGWLTAGGFLLSDGKVVTCSNHYSLARVLASKPYITGPGKSSDANLQALLDLRFDPECSIYTAVDFAKQNMEILRAAGYSFDALNDGEKAKIAYLGHHLGGGDAKKFIENTISPSRAQHLLEQQVGVADAIQRANKKNGDYLTAHRAWLDEFVNDHVKLDDFFCNGKAPSVRTLFTLIDVIKKKV